MSIDKLKVRRDEDGNVIPNTGVTPVLGLRVVCLPLTYGDSLNYDSFGKSVMKWSNEEKARLLTKNCLEVEGEEIGEVKAEEIDDFEAFALSEILNMILTQSALNRLYQESEKKGNEEAPEDE